MNIEKKIKKLKKLNKRIKKATEKKDWKGVAELRKEKMNLFLALSGDEVPGGPPFPFPPFPGHGHGHGHHGHHDGFDPMDLGVVDRPMTKRRELPLGFPAVRIEGNYKLLPMPVGPLKKVKAKGKGGARAAVFENGKSADEDPIKPFVQAMKDGKLLFFKEPCTDVTAPKSTVAITQPQVIYSPKRLFVVPSVLGVAIVQDFKIGKDSQLVAAGPLPAEMFSPLSFGSDMNCDTAQVTQIVSLYLGNIGPADVTVTSGMMGTAMLVV